jgi:orotidine-5'-phosphate decarboxylase
MDAVILFPQAGPVTEYEWIRAAQERNLGVIVGGEMTHPRYLEGDFSEGREKNYTGIFEGLGIPFPVGGFIRNSAPDLMYIIAARMGVDNFIVPGNKPERILHYKGLVMEWGVRDPMFFSPGFITQDGSISAGAKAAGRKFHPIVGRALTNAKNMKEAALLLTRELAD